MAPRKRKGEPHLEEIDEQELDQPTDLEEELAQIMAEAEVEIEEVAYPLCRCGCNEHTKGGDYRPGHDAKHKGKLMRTIFYATGEEREQAKFELSVRGWSHFYEKFARGEARRIRRARLQKCSICGRPLLDEESRELGIGPVCRRRQAGEVVEDWEED